jgi:hypothetical protein
MLRQHQGKYRVNNFDFAQAGRKKDIDEFEMDFRKNY